MPANRPPDSLAEILVLARLYASEEETGELVGWIALRKGRSQAARGLSVVPERAMGRPSERG